jgi:hypothetical protein
VTHAATTSDAQIEFAASQNRQDVTKLDEKEGDEPTEIRLRPASGQKLLKYRLTLIVVFMLPNKFRLFAPGTHEVKHRTMSATANNVSEVVRLTRNNLETHTRK